VNESPEVRLGRSISLAEYHQLQAEQMTEAQLQAVVIAAAKARGFLVYHTFDSRRSAAGYPDLHMVHAARGVSLMRELKTQKGRVSADQAGWLTALEAAGVDAGVWRPIDWFTGRINTQLDQP